MENTLFYLFSTTAQTYGAIIGIVGLLVVYRLENQSNLRGSIRNRLVDEPRRFLPRLLGNKTYGWSPDDIVDKFQEPDEQDRKMLARTKREEKKNYLYLRDEVKRINNSRVIGKRIRYSFAIFMAYHFPFLILAPIISIFFTKELSPYAWQVFWCLLVIVFLSCISVAGISKFLLKTPKEDAHLIEPADDED